jgi:alpha-L-fucosidase 2
MNHWLVNPTNLEECNLALFDQMERLLEAGKMNARNVTGCDGILFYGIAGNDQTTWSPEGGLWTGAAAWMAQHFWTHYEYTLDRDFLAHRAYPFTKQVGLFYKDWLVKNQEGKYVTGFSFSPENAPPNGFVNNVHSFVDTATVREVMRHLLEGGRILDIDHDLWPVWQDLHDNVLPYQIAESGALKEWPAPLEEQPNHRHFSHLYPFFPGDELTRESTPRLFAAAHKALLLREAGSPAWIYFSYAIAACMHARFGEGDEALRNLREMMRTGTLPNLISWLFLSQYRLMQTDGGLVATCAIAEMLLQSHEGFIRLLPALPSQWPNGRFKGLCARGAFTADAAWTQGRITQASIRSLKGAPCRVFNSRPWKTVKVACQGHTIAHTLAPKLNTIEFATEPGKTYVLEFA